VLRRHLPALVALGVTFAVAGTIVFSQPLGAPWWLYADADATYVGSSLELASNDHARYVDHPGLPIQEALAVTFDAEWLATKALHGTSHAAFMRHRLLHLDRTRGTFRSFAVAFYLAGALLACWLVARMLRSWWWGMAAGVLWIGMPAGALDAIQIRPETLLSLLCLVVMFCLTRAFELRSARWYGWAGIALGFAVVVKLHALGLVVPLAVAALLAPPAPGWRGELGERARAFVGRHRVLVGVVVTLWLLLAVRYTAPHFPFRGASKSGVAFAVLLIVVFAVHTVLALRAERSGSPRMRRLLDPFHSFVLGAILLGLAVPISIVVDDGIRALGATRATLSGGGVNAGVKPFALSGIDFGAWPLREALLVFVVAGVAAAYGLWKRELVPVLWFLGAAVLAVMASARLGVTRYYAPPFVVSIPPALWLLKRLRAPGVVAATALVLVVAAPQLQHRTDQADAARQDERVAAALLARTHLAPGQVALVTPGGASADACYFAVVQPYLGDHPVYPYRALPALSSQATDYAAAHGLKAVTVSGFAPAHQNC
jgi:hypothetical protein